ncbi:hypothetical protein ACGFNP_25295 [Nonomuraea sp. NPDC049269]|uniref:hypothetical protein n=1 Tax=Nonomuraea sp. NPDC049269 TaxID=3364349 RepID=UPI0037195CD2
MHREEAIVEFFRARLTDEEQHVERIKSYGGCCAGCFCGCSGLAAIEAVIEADRALLERYDYCVRMGGCPGNEDLDAALNEYEMHTFPLRIARFSDHPVYATLALDGRWIEANYVAARDASA